MRSVARAIPLAASAELSRSAVIAVVVSARSASQRSLASPNYFLAVCSSPTAISVACAPARGILYVSESAA